jgi:protein-disulfide isomerase
MGSVNDANANDPELAADPAPAVSPGSPTGQAPAPVPGEPVRRQNRLAAAGLLVLAIALALGAGIAIGRATAPVAGDASPSAVAGSPATGSPAASSIADLPSDGPRLGSADAKVVIDYWSDFQCPFCARFASEVIPALDSRIANGSVALVHRDYVFLGDESLDAAIAVHCAGQEGKYWVMHDAVYAAQQGENQGAFARTKLAAIAASVGLDATAFAACMDDRAVLVDVLDDTAAGVRAGVVSTPTIDVNGTRFLGVPDVTRFLATVDAAIAGASPAPLPTAQPSADPWTGTATTGREAGSATAPITVELWMDYQATGSAVVATDLEPGLRTRIGEGRIRVVQHDLATLGDESVLAASMVRCIAQQGGPAWFAHDVLAVSAQGSGAGIYTPRNILRFGARLGLDVQALSACLDDPAVAADVRADTAAGTAEGLTAGPAVVVKRGDVELARFTGTLDAAKILAAIDAAG